ncbi:hypothetical protein [Pseudomonas sp. HS6]|uniref:hypothetical protein n=1 Tax=Pseudomonas sp. HS6 TaxID=2850559 RepID=UPI002019F4E9|nr:hypothetical protein [Pseudomonas sp. HS6]UQS15269.1 hypothetical protein JJN09_29530 [Pseudomonas sp. HS6]
MDTVDYSTSAAGINVDIRYNTPGRAGIGGDSEGDTLINIEKVIGSAFNDTFSIDTLTAGLGQSQRHRQRGQQPHHR